MNSFVFLLGEGGNKDHLLCTQQKVSVGDRGVLASLERQKVKATFNFFHLILLGWHRHHMSSVLTLIPSGSSPEVLSESRPMSPEGSSASDSSLVVHRAAKSRVHLLGLSKSRETVTTTSSYNSEHSLH